MEIQTLNQLLVEELRDLYDAEKRLVKALPKMMKAAGSKDLKQAIGDHLEQTQRHVTRLERAFDLLGQKARAKTCEAMKGLIEEGEETISDLKNNEAFLDVALIAAAQRVEHYEIAGYGTVRTWADKLELTEVSDLMQQTLDEEKATDEHLTEISEGLLIEVPSSDGIERKQVGRQKATASSGKRAAR
jgi:ferritin-like metal-binding protein YciE